MSGVSRTVTPGGSAGAANGRGCSYVGARRRERGGAAGAGPARCPLPEAVLVGPRFAESLAGLDDGYLAKAFKACVDAVTGRIRELPARNVHPLRSGVGANSADVVRDSDGARCLRAYIEQNTASARRLHYWTLPDGGVELCRVVLHGDVEA